jgi:DNA-binding GntR family transcriptional regulator
VGSVPLPLPRLAGQSVVDTACDALRDAIVRGAFAPGAQLVEQRIATSLGVSRGTAREALRRLRDEGFATGAPNRGIFVRELTLDDVIDIYNVRAGIEGVAVRICARLRRPTASLRTLIDEMDARAGRDDAVGVSDAELAFHTEICRLSRNAHLAATFRSIAGLTRLAWTGEYAAYGSVTAVGAEHLPLVEAIESGDEERAVQALIAHMDIALTRTRHPAGTRGGLGRARQTIRSPPLMSSAAPVMYAAASPQRKPTSAPTSSGVPSRGIGNEAA